MKRTPVGAVSLAIQICLSIFVCGLIVAIAWTSPAPHAAWFRWYGTAVAALLAACMVVLIGRRKGVA